MKEKFEDGTGPVNPESPMAQMSFGEVTRYLQGGYDAPVQRTLAKHITFSNTSQRAVEQVNAIRSIGQQLASAHVFEADEEIAYLDENVLAAYLEGTLSAEEMTQIHARIGQEHGLYQQFAAAKHETETRVPRRLRTPEVALRTVVAEVPQHVAPPIVDWSERLRTLWQRWTGAVALRWAVPAFTFALGVLMTTFVLPRDPSLVMLPPLAGTDLVDVESVEPDQVVFGEAEKELAYMTLPNKGTVTFVWPAIEDAVRYEVQVFDSEEGTPLGLPQQVTEAKWHKKVTHFTPDQRFTILVQALYADEDPTPVVSMDVIRSK